MSTETMIAGVYVGRQIAPGMYAEEIASNRYVIRQLTRQDATQRLGEVCGGKSTGGTSHYQAMTMKGELVGSASTLLGAARQLAFGKDASIPRVPAMSVRRQWLPKVAMA